ncbi:outer membrane beta-barrel protein [Mangrovimonas sp. YM274]|uniref:outer membrane beta-barrel protein n=1 Tax=Mangrovimonas sp. YM274 TaxID=3070660 RepID=UPI0027DDAAB0|nr:outer membrane beta-barrel protein [Mangrovimonas sp. YM274]WMI69761.1 hypothetical protein RBH95_05240 [Mangrovimonas sp. YM274]
MRATILLLVTFLLGIYSTKAQEFAIGAKGGLNYYSIGDINSRANSIANLNEDELFYPNKKLGYQFGGYFTVEYGKFFLRPEIVYLSSKNSYDFPDEKAYWETSRIEVPVLVGFEIFDPLSLYLGPGFNFYNDTSLDGVQVTSYSDGGPDLDKTTVNFNIGVMVRFGRFGVDLRYEQGLKETEEELLDIVHSAYGVNLADLKSYTPNMLRLSVFIDIFRTNPDDLDGFFSNLFRSNKCHCPYN